MSGQVIRPRGARIYTNGATKRKATKEKREKQELAKNLRMENFMSSTNGTPKLLSRETKNQKLTSKTQTPDLN